MKKTFTKGFTRTPKFGVSSQGERGFTLIELLISLGIIIVLLAIVFSSFVKFRDREALLKNTEMVVAVLRQARNQTLSSKNSSVYGVHFSATSTTLFVGGSYSSGTTTNQKFNLSNGDNALTITLTGGGNDVIFRRLSGETSQNGTVVISSTKLSYTKTVTIYKTGLVEVQ